MDEVVESFQEASYNALNIIVNNDDENARKINHVNKIKVHHNLRIETF